MGGSNICYGLDQAGFLVGSRFYCISPYFQLLSFSSSSRYIWKSLQLLVGMSSSPNLRMFMRRGCWLTEVEDEVEAENGITDIEMEMQSKRRGGKGCFLVALVVVVVKSI